MYMWIYMWWYDIIETHMYIHVYIHIITGTYQEEDDIAYILEDDRFLDTLYDRRLCWGPGPITLFKCNQSPIYIHLQW